MITPLEIHASDEIKEAVSPGQITPDVDGIHDGEITPGSVDDITYGTTDYSRLPTATGPVVVSLTYGGKTLPLN